MLALLSPAKKLHAEVTAPAVPPTLPALMGDVELLSQTTAALSPADLKGLMGISDKLAELNHARFQQLSFPFTADNALPAALAFAGDTYVGLDAGSLSDADLTWGQDHLGILSGLYGLLRPLDLMQAYRLEMGIRLDNPRGKNLYAFWKENLTGELQARLADHEDKSIINLASKEYFSAVDVAVLPGPVITPIFLEEKEGKARTISFMAKRARGSMARFMLQHRVSTPAGLQAYQVGGYRFDGEQSTDSRWVFRRPQPPPAGAR
jgi:cytoplasmic iron level regulating protein YaaA (DUF328/UPF0246 family)